VISVQWQDAIISLCYDEFGGNFLKDRVYLDYAATTPVDDRVIRVMLPYFNDVFGNPSSIHFWGQKADYALEESRRIVADLLGAKPEEIIFTAHGTESDNLALRGVSLEQKRKRAANHILISPVEHHAVTETIHSLSREHGFEVEFLSVDEFGRVDVRDLETRIRPDTALVSVVYANNEIGTINPIDEIGKVCNAKGVPFHSDAVQAAAHLPLDMRTDHVDLLAIGAHKFYGPKGVGALFVRKGLAITPTMTGGKQERGLRAGTQNVPLIVGLAEAFRITRAEMGDRNKNLTEMRNFLIQGVLTGIPDSRLTGHPEFRLPNHASFVFEGVDGNLLLTQLDAEGFACSSGSACKVGIPKPSEVLTAIGLDKKWALGSLRVTLGRQTSFGQIKSFLQVLLGVVARNRNLRADK
jgi:cysteine desulfurase